jgi:hypothetical protein
MSFGVGGGRVKNMTKKRAPVRGWWCPNVQLHVLLGLRELIGETTDANRVYSRTNLTRKQKDPRHDRRHLREMRRGGAEARELTVCVGIDRYLKDNPWRQGRPNHV